MNTASSTPIDPDQLIDELGLQPHPEGGHFRETFRDSPPAGQTRAPSTAIYYLLKAGERSHWHRVDATEIWHWYAGDPLRLSVAANDAETPEHMTLGPNISAGERPQGIVRKDEWQAAEPLGAWTLVGCTVAPGFDFAGFELAPQDWQPGTTTK
jgi:uncharacterized protein